ncbi:dephospho-CoA kinase [Paramicrobacterium humi]|uniref:Dephospho-CoA kinase n=1 Tax=Paramicrobacterium humi TaxID=640635 RepID=A0A1H4QXZ7_9MICO|nr:dephospho-CoA kinase [Microbacterium humi]SEC24354.1 dephospho-CoA kinase [Microbacterium humi]
MLLVGLTGGIASGKSTVARMLHEHGAVIVDADVLAREVVEPGTPALSAVVEHFGDAVLQPDGSLDRAALAGRVFGNPTELARLNGIVHPAVREASQQRIREAAAADPDAVIVYDVPLLAESRSTDEFDLVVVAHTPAAARVDRLVTLRGLERTAAEQRVTAQADDETRLALADVVIDTAGSLEHTREQVHALWQRLTRESQP